MNGWIDFDEIHGCVYLGRWIDRWIWTDKRDYVD